MSAENARRRDFIHEYKIFSHSTMMLIMFTAWCFCWQNFGCEVINNSRLHYAGKKIVLGAWAPFCILRYFRLQIPSSLSPFQLFFCGSLPLKMQTPDSSPSSILCSLTFAATFLPLLSPLVPPLLKNSSKTLLISHSCPKRQVSQLRRDKLAVLASRKDFGHPGSQMVCH